MKSKLPEGWKEVKLGTVVESVSERPSKDFDQVITINTSDVLNGTYLNHEVIPNKNLPGQFKKAFCKNDILFSEIRPINKRHAFVDFDPIGYVASTKLMVLRIKDKLVIPKFFYYYITSKKILEYLQLLAETRSGTFPQIRYTEIKSLDVLIPTLKEQRSIIGYIEMLDDQIELNNKININLEEQVQALFKHWFGDFEFPNANGNPYKSSGGEMIDSELGMMPKGWEVVELEKLVKSIESGNWGKEKEEGNYTEEVLCIRGTDIPEIKKGKRGDMPTRYIIPRHLENKALRTGDIVVEMSGGSPTQSTGRSLYISQEFLHQYSTPILCTNFCKIFKIKEGYEKMFYYNWEYLYSLGHMFSYENGTTGIKNLDEKSLLKNNFIVKPSKEVLSKFNAYVSVINKEKAILGKQNQTLAQLRDTLLPKLMSGEIRIPLD